MTQEALPCIVCGSVLVNVVETADNQAVDGLAFTSHGQYGSTVFDPMDGSFLEVNVCDECLVAAGERGRVLSGKDRRMVVTYLRGYGVPLVVGWERLSRPYVEWRRGLPGYGDEDRVVVEPEEVGTDLSENIEWLTPAIRAVKLSLAKEE